MSSWVYIVLLPLLSSADCAEMPAINCAKIHVTKIIQKKSSEYCVAQVKTDQNKLFEAFFKPCPKANQDFVGNLVQRPDMTVEAMANCQYEFNVSRDCKR